MPVNDDDGLLWACELSNSFNFDEDLSLAVVFEWLDSGSSIVDVREGNISNVGGSGIWTNVGRCFGVVFNELVTDTGSEGIVGGSGGRESAECDFVIGPGGIDGPGGCGIDVERWISDWGLACVILGSTSSYSGTDRAAAGIICGGSGIGATTFALDNATS